MSHKTWDQGCGNVASAAVCDVGITGMPAQTLASLRPITLPTNAPRNVEKDGQALETVTHMGDLDGMPGFSRAANSHTLVLFSW